MSETEATSEMVSPEVHSLVHELRGATNLDGKNYVFIVTNWNLAFPSIMNEVTDYTSISSTCDFVTNRIHRYSQISFTRFRYPKVSFMGIAALKL